MMRVCFLSVVFFLFFNPCNSQTFQGGGLLGICASQVDGDTHSGYDKAGPIAGLFVNKKLSKNWGAQLEIRYIQKGSRNDLNPSKPEEQYYRLRLNYFEIPIIARYYYQPKISFDAGLAFAFLAKSREEYMDNNGTVNFNTSVFKDFEFNVNLGFNYLILSKLSVGFRFQYSILPIRGTRGNGNIQIQSGQYNNVLNLLFCYQL